MPDDPDARVDSVRVLVEIENLDSSLSESSDSSFAHEGEHAAVVVTVDMDIENVSATNSLQAVEEVRFSPLADVRHAFEHVLTLPGGESRMVKTQS
jgi:hypothetical protein